MKEILLSALLILTVSCATKPKEKSDTNFNMSEVQKKLIKGKTTKNQATELLGAPEMVNTDHTGQEQWVYSKSSMKAGAQESSVGLGALSFIGGALLGIGGSMGQASAEVSSTSITLYVNFNKRGLLESYNYKRSRI